MFTAVIQIIKDNRVLFLALLVTVAVYSKVLFFGHISWDDPEMVFKNKAVKHFDIKAMFSGHYVGNYLPVTMIVHALSWMVFGGNAGGHHAVNVVFHLLNGVLVYKVTAYFFSDKRLRGLTVLVFLLHPLQLETVAWISELKSTLSASFFFGALLFYLRYSEKQQRKDYLIAFLFFVVSCLSKSSAVILPLVLLCTDLYRSRTISIRLLTDKIPFFIVALLFGLINLKTQAADMFINYSHAFPYHERTGYAGYALLKYLGMFLLPVNLSVLYPYPSAKIQALIIGFIFILLLGFTIYRAAVRKNFRLLALVLLCVCSLLLVLQFVPFGEVLYADRYMYQPVVFFSMLVLFLFSKLRIGVKVLLGLLFVVLPLASWQRMDVWRNSAVLYADILKKFPESFVALNSLGAELMMQNQDKKALEYLNRSVKVSPKNYKGYYNRGLLMLKNGKPAEAIKDFNRAIALYDYHKAYVGRASAYYMLQDIPKAMQDAEYVLKTEPGQPKALFVLANCYSSLNQIDKALTLYNMCIEVVDDDADFYFKRAIAYGKKQDFVSSLQDLDACISLNPGYYEAYYWRGVAKFNLKQEPCRDLRIAADKGLEQAQLAYNKYCF